MSSISGLNAHDRAMARRLRHDRIMAITREIALSAA